MVILHHLFILNILPIVSLIVSGKNTTTYFRENINSPAILEHSSTWRYYNSSIPL